ncbi:adenine phosphoribosyltransferase [Vermiconidia calcicola]|uniref:Adenine phosphoribosyltransferase n=1 Tax=Vermiconidia calcicola TaxID=1690605 RepID=A0ACC3P153_9PEZI|nr:adenine phosphoribosyltransferase [Vermiconidia calcicola]
MSDPKGFTASSEPAHPSHGYPESASLSKQASNDKGSTASHPPPSKPDPTTSHTPRAFDPSARSAEHAAKAGLAASSATSSSELTSLKVKLQAGLRQFPDFPSPGILFEDIMPLFSSHSLHTDLIRALELQIADVFQTSTGEKSDIDVIVGLEARGFLFGPSLALRLGAGFVPVRKQGKLPGSCETEGYEKEYGPDNFQMQSDAIKKGQKVVVVDDIIATGGSAAAAGKLVRKLGGDLLGYVFMMELDFLKGRAKLDAPVHTLFAGQEEGSKKDT